MSVPQVGKLFAKCVLLTFPYLLLFATYVYYDPAHVLRHYTDFNNLYLHSRDFISTQTFVNNNDTQHYTSFILGNSRSGSYYTTDWAPYIQDKQPYHFDASSESLAGVYGKVKFLDTHAAGLKNVLIVLDRTLLRVVGNPPGGPLYMNDSRTSTNTWPEFQAGFVRAYFSDFYCFSFIRYKLTGKGTPPPISDKCDYQPISNDMPIWKLDKEIAADSAGYYTKNSKVFAQPVMSNEVYKPVIQEKQLAMLRGMAAIFRRQHTDCRIVVSPLLDKIPLNPQDVQTLKTLFGDDKVYDYSGVNRFTRDYRNYYEASHYRPIVARQIMREIYARPAQ